MNTDFPAEWHALFNAALNGSLTEAENARLSEVLKNNSAARQLWFLYTENEVSLAEQPRQTAQYTLSQPAIKSTARWVQWRSLASAAAGLVIGLFGATLVFGYVGASQRKTITLLQDGFESGPTPQVTGVPQSTGIWSGDFTEVVGSQQDVKPSGGAKMLRFLRADYQGKAQPAGSYVSDLYRFVDLRPFRASFGDGGAVVQLSAAFNAISFPESERYGCSMTLFALDTATEANLITRRGGDMANDALAMARNSRVMLDRDPETWQRVTTELRLPPNADFLLIHIALDHSTKSQHRLTFDGHYLDDVRLTLARRAPLP